MSLALACTSIDCAAGLPVEGDVRRFGYDAAQESRNRKLPAAAIRSEDEELPPAKRRKLQANATDIQRNFAIAAWAIRKHLDFVTTFAFSSDNAQRVLSPDNETDPAAQRLQEERSQLDDDIEGIVNEASEAERCDASGRHDLATMLRLGESLATLLGDHGFLELADGTMQGIESDRILTPKGETGSIIHGVKVDARGSAVAYAVHRRKGSGYEFERWIPASNMIWRGYYDHFDQVRGISPMAPALNSLRDVYEGFDYALAKAKLAQLFGFKFTRQSLQQFDDSDNVGTEERPKYSVDAGKGVWNLNMLEGEDAEIMAAEVPGDSFQNYTEMMIAVSMLALDLPWNFFKVDATNFFGSRAALTLYLESVQPKRRANKKILRRWTKRQLSLAVLQGRLRLPRGMTVADLRYSWTPRGVPWWNPSQEADGALKSINAGLNNPQDICLETGTNFFRNVDRIAEALAYAKQKKVSLSFALTQPQINISTP